MTFSNRRTKIIRSRQTKYILLLSSFFFAYLLLQIRLGQDILGSGQPHKVRTLQVCAYPRRGQTSLFEFLHKQVGGLWLNRHFKRKLPKIVLRCVSDLCYLAYFSSNVIKHQVVFLLLLFLLEYLCSHHGLHLVSIVIFTLSIIKYFI